MSANVHSSLDFDLVIQVSCQSCRKQVEFNFGAVLELSANKCSRIYHRATCADEEFINHRLVVDVAAPLTANCKTGVVGRSARL